MSIKIICTNCKSFIDISNINCPVCGIKNILANPPKTRPNAPPFTPPYTPPRTAKSESQDGPSYKSITIGIVVLISIFSLMIYLAGYIFTRNNNSNEDKSKTPTVAKLSVGEVFDHLSKENSTEYSDKLREFSPDEISGYVKNKLKSELNYGNINQSSITRSKNILEITARNNIVINPQEKYNTIYNLITELSNTLNSMGKEITEPTKPTYTKPEYKGAFPFTGVYLGVVSTPLALVGTEGSFIECESVNYVVQRIRYPKGATISGYINPCSGLKYTLDNGREVVDAIICDERAYNMDIARHQRELEETSASYNEKKKNYEKLLQEYSNWKNQTAGLVNQRNNIQEQIKSIVNGL